MSTSPFLEAGEVSEHDVSGWPSGGSSSSRKGRSQSVVSDEKEVNAESPSCLTRGGLLTSTWILTSVSLGMGVFVQPKVVARMGYVQGTILIVLFAAITNYSQILLIMVMGGEVFLTYGEVCKVILGDAGLVLNSITMTLTCLVANAGHLATATQMLHDIICWYFTGSYSYNFTSSQRLVTLCLLCGFVLPFCLDSTELHSLRYISTTSVSICVTLALSVMVLAGSRLYSHGIASGDQGVPAFSSDVGASLSGCAAICFAYSSIINIVSVNRDISTVHRNEDAEKVQRRSIFAVSLTSIVCAFFYASLSLLCVLAYGNLCKQNEGNILYLFPPSFYWITAWCFALVVSVTLLYPVINNPMVNNMETLCLLFLPPEPTSFLGRHRRAVISLIGMVFVIALDTFVTDLANIFGLCGSLGLGTVSMILPGWLAMKRRHVLPRIHWFGAFFIFICGIIITFGSSYAVVSDILKKS